MKSLRRNSAGLIDDTIPLSDLDDFIAYMRANNLRPVRGEYLPGKKPTLYIERVDDRRASASADSSAISAAQDLAYPDDAQSIF